MSTRGSALQRAIEFFKNENLEVAKIALQRVKEIVEERIALEKASRKSQVNVLSTPRKRRRTKAEIAADKAKAAATAGQTTIEEGAKAAGAAGTVTI